MMRRFASAALLCGLLCGCGRSDDLPRRMRWRYSEPSIESDEWVMRNSCVRQLKRARWTWAQYGQVLDELRDRRYLVSPIREFAQAVSNYPDRVVVGLRHDMDGSLCKAERMAELDAAAGFSASFFLNHTDPYFAWGWPVQRRRESVVPRYRHIQKLGHEVGLHVDALSMAVMYGLDSGDLLAADLAWLRTHGIEIVGVAAHGSPAMHKARAVNYEMFAGMTTRTSLFFEGRVIPLGQIALAPLGLHYESYHVPHQYYMSEAGGAWHGFADPVAELRKRMPGENVQMLIHPVWWGSEEKASQQQ